MACYYGSASATSGGIVFKDGSEFFIEWFPEPEDSSTSINGAGHALVNDVRTWYRILKAQYAKDDLRCIHFYKDKSEDVLFAYGNC